MLLAVPAATSHEAAVVRCASCGGPRQGQAEACGFCGSDFTLHDQDLDTICPQCMARISGKASFCHGCGTAVLVEELAGELTEHPCPACGADRRLAGRRLGEGGYSALECGACGGLWVSREAFRRLAEKARVSEVAMEGVSDAPAGRQPVRNRGPIYRPCPRCGARMNRQNYGRRSGIILDLCREHGVWFDAHELEGVLAWVRRGGLAREEEAREQEAREKERQERLAKLAERQPGSLLGPAEQRTGSVDLITSLIDLAGRAAGWLLGLR